MSEHWTYPHQPNAPWNEEDEDIHMKDIDIIMAAKLLESYAVELPEQIRIGWSGIGFWNLTEQNKEKLRILPDPVAKAVLGYAMLKDGGISRVGHDRNTRGWSIMHPIEGGMDFLDRYQEGDDEFASLFAAWKYTRGIND